MRNRSAGSIMTGAGASAAASPLAGMRVLDVASTFMGPYCALVLGQLGAEVIKVEPPAGDITRYIGDARGDGMGPIFLNVNRGKRSVVLDLKAPPGRQALDALIAQSDVLIHNLRPAAMEKLDLEAERLTALNEKLIYCHTVGFGSQGPYRDRAAYDDVVQAASGLAHTQGGNGPPAYVRAAIADKVVGLMAANAVLGALVERERSGLGQVVEVPMFESMVSFNLLEAQGQWVFEERPGPTGYARTASPDRKPYATADGFVAVVVYTDAQWRSFFEIIGRHADADDPRFASIRERTEHIDALYQLIKQSLKQRPTEEWLALFDSHGIPAMPVNHVEDLFDDDHLRAVGMFEQVAHHDGRTLVQVRPPWTFSRSVAPPLKAAAPLGADTAAVLKQLGLSGHPETQEP